MTFAHDRSPLVLPRARRLLTPICASLALLGCGARSELRAPRSHDEGVLCFVDDSASLRGRIRDFSSSHPDFEAETLGDDPDIVAELLGEDRTPVYAPGEFGTTATTHGKASFDQWYHDVPGVNRGRDLDLPLSGDISAFTFDSDAFFPIDGELFGNEGRAHNYHFTLELHGTFRYRGGEVFSITGDDDLYIFVDDHLAVNLGGVHSSTGGAVSVDALADELGLIEGEAHPLDVFFAERHTEGSTLHLRLTGPALCLSDP
jgi:fibro-slime domain-containing protein